MNKNQINTKFKVSLNNNQNTSTNKQELNSQNISLTDIKNTAKQVFIQCKAFNGFEKLLDKVSFKTQIPPVLFDFSCFFFNKITTTFNSKSNQNIMNLRDCELFSKLMKYSFQAETEYVNKFYINYQDNEYFKVILLSNLYKIFISNLLTNTNVKLTCYDFLCMKNLICSDFPKKIFENICEVYYIISNKDVITKETSNIDEFILNSNFYNQLLSQEINIVDFLVIYSVTYINYDFLMYMRNSFLFENTMDVDMNNKNIGNYVEVIKETKLNDCDETSTNKKEENNIISNIKLLDEIINKNEANKEDLEEKNDVDNGENQIDIERDTNTILNNNNIPDILNLNKFDSKNEESKHIQTETDTTFNIIIKNESNFNIQMKNSIKEEMTNIDINDNINNNNLINSNKDKLFNIDKDEKKKESKLKEVFLNKNSCYSSILASHLENEFNLKEDFLSFKSISIDRILNMVNNSLEFKSILSKLDLKKRLYETLFLLLKNKKDTLSCINSENKSEKNSKIIREYIESKRLIQLSFKDAESVLNDFSSVKVNIFDFYKMFISNKNNLLQLKSVDKYINIMETNILNIIDRT